MFSIGFGRDGIHSVPHVRLILLVSLGAGTMGGKNGDIFAQACHKWRGLLSPGDMPRPRGHRCGLQRNRDPQIRPCFCGDPVPLSVIKDRRSMFGLDLTCDAKRVATMGRNGTVSFVATRESVT